MCCTPVNSGSEKQHRRRRGNNLEDVTGYMTLRIWQGTGIGKHSTDSAIARTVEPPGKKLRSGKQTGGAHCAPPVTYLRISVQIRIQTRWKNLTSLSYEFGIGQYTFYPAKLSRFAKKNKVRQKYQNFIRGTLTSWVKRLSDEQKFSKVKHFLEGSGHLNFMNPFEYSKSLPAK